MFQDPIQVLPVVAVTYGFYRLRQFLRSLLFFMSLTVSRHTAQLNVPQLFFFMFSSSLHRGFVVWGEEGAHRAKVEFALCHSKSKYIFWMWIITSGVNLVYLVEIVFVKRLYWKLLIFFFFVVVVVFFWGGRGFLGWESNHESTEA